MSLVWLSLLPCIHPGPYASCSLSLSVPHLQNGANNTCLPYRVAVKDDSKIMYVKCFKYWKPSINAKYDLLIVLSPFFRVLDVFPSKQEDFSNHTNAICEDHRCEWGRKISNPFLPFWTPDKQECFVLATKSNLVDSEKRQEFFQWALHPGITQHNLS